MISLAQVSDISTFKGTTAYCPSYGVVTITDYIPGNVWGVEISIDGIPVQWVSEAELFFIDAGDTVVVSDDDGTIYVGLVTRIRLHSLTAVFQINGQRKVMRFGYHYVTEVLAPDTAAETAVA